MSTFREKAIALWGVLWVTALLSQAVMRLLPRAIEPWTEGSMSGLQMALYVGVVVIMAYSEGYRAFQLRFSPRVVSRAVHLGKHPKPLHVVFALFFCMSLFHSTKRQKTVSWFFVFGILALVIMVRQLSQPWRGIIDGGVVVGLGWGIAAIWWIFARALMGHPAPEPPDLPEGVRPATA
ncbi:MAG: hypothetical protein GXP55_00375 [Deltaproteobacteria bacterium]|nr:hypothetical protein [Deltaproteobacteria bacterium]